MFRGASKCHASVAPRLFSSLTSSCLSPATRFPFRSFSAFLDSYKKHVDERGSSHLEPKPLNADQAKELVKLLENTPKDEEKTLLDLLTYRVPPGVDEAAYVKAAFLTGVAKGEQKSPSITPERAIELLGTMQGGYNVTSLVQLLDDPKLQDLAAKQLCGTLLMFDAFYDVESKAKKGNKAAQKILESWAKAEWFLKRKEVPKKLTLTVFKVSGETNTDDLSPATEAWSRPDIPLHAEAMYKNQREGITNAKQQIIDLKKKGHPIAFVGDVVGTGSSRKSAANSVLWHTGDDIPFVPNKRTGGVCIGSTIAPIFFNTMEDSGALPLEMDVSKLNMGDVIDIYPYEGVVKNNSNGQEVATFKIRSKVLFDEVRAGGRIPLIIGRGLTNRARASLGQQPSEVFQSSAMKTPPAGSGFTLAQKMVGRACGLKEGQGVLPGQYCEPKMTTVGSQDTTGPMTRDELKDLACLGFQADLVMQSFCHTAAYPKPVDIVTQTTLPSFIRTRGGVSLRPGDGIIHSWLNRMLLPDTCGTGADSHTRFPIGISFPAGSGLVAFAAATGVMPLDMPESVLVKFKGKMQPGMTLRDLVHAIPYCAKKAGMLTTEKKNKKNIFSGAILEIEGLGQLKCEQAFELSDASAERSAAGCTIKLDKEPIIEYLNSNIVMLKWMIAEGYGERRTIERRIAQMQHWVANPKLLEADKHAKYVATLEIDLDTLKEPILCAPNDPDDARLLSEVQGTKIDEVFIGSCMTNIGHFRAAGSLLKNMEKEVPTRLWIAPPTKMDAAQLTAEGYYGIFGKAGARTEMPGCSLCMGNQARVAPNSTVVSTSTRNFPNRLGAGAKVFLASAELAAVSAIMGKLPTVEEYQKAASHLTAKSAELFRYLNFDQLPSYTGAASTIQLSPEIKEFAENMKKKQASA